MLDIIAFVDEDTGCGFLLLLDFTDNDAVEEGDYFFEC
jgi:hypothetical protein